MRKKGLVESKQGKKKIIKDWTGSMQKSVTIMHIIHKTYISFWFKCSCQKRIMGQAEVAPSLQ